MSVTSEFKSPVLDTLSPDGISWRINFALARKYKDRIPAERGPRTQWVASHYDTHRATADGWLFFDRKPREPFITKIAIDTGVDKKWLVHGGPNPYESVPYEEPIKLNANDKMHIYSLLNKLSEQYGFSYQYAGEMLEMAVAVLTRHRMTCQHADPDMDWDLALGFARLLNELSQKNKMLDDASQE